MDRELDNDQTMSGVASVDRALLILTAFRRDDPSLSLAELTRRTGLVKSTILRLVISLEKFSLLKRKEDGHYRLDAGVLRLASVFQEQTDLEGLVLPALRRLVDATQETASFYVRHGDQRLCLFRVDSPHRLRLHIRAGDTLPMDESAVAQVLRTFEESTADVKKLLQRFPVYSPGRRDPHISSLAMPIFGPRRRLAGALAITGPVTRFTEESATEVAETLRQVSAELSLSLGDE